MSKITIPELESYLWGAAEILRGSMAAGSYKNYIFPLLFFKRVNDVYDEEYRAALAESDNDEEYAAMEENHMFVVPQASRWSVIRNTNTDVGAAISKAMRALENANPQLEGVFGDAAWTNKNRLPDQLLRSLVEHLSSNVLSIENCPEDELGTGYEYLIGKFADDSGHTAQEFYTNRTLVHLMAEILQPKPGESIYDPTCGSAGMLISSVANVKKHGMEYRSVKVYGQEISPLTASIGKMNLFLHGVQEFDIRQGDTLTNPHFLEGDRIKTFDVVLANPPYSIKEWNRDMFEHDPYGRNFLGTPPQGRADFAFFQHILKSMDPVTGRCAILFPHGILFREEESDLRKKLVESDLIECVIGVAPGLFFNSPMQACVVICRSKKDAKMKGKVKFIDAKELYIKDGKHNSLSEENISKIANEYFSQTTTPGFSSINSIEEILDNGAKLSLAIYVVSESRKVKCSIKETYFAWKQNTLELSDSVSKLIGGDEL